MPSVLPCPCQRQHIELVHKAAVPQRLLPLLRCHIGREPAMFCSFLLETKLAPTDLRYLSWIGKLINSLSSLIDGKHQLIWHLQLRQYLCSSSSCRPKRLSHWFQSPSSLAKPVFVSPPLDSSSKDKRITKQSTS